MHKMMRTLRIKTSEMSFITLQTGGLVLRGRLFVVDHALDDSMDRVQEVGVLAHGQQCTDLGIQQIVPVAVTPQTIVTSPQ